MADTRNSLAGKGVKSYVRLIKFSGGAIVAALLLTPAFAHKTKGAAPVDDQQKILQVLNRLTFGPRPGDEQAVRRMGLKKWVDQQLHPGSIPENPVLEAKLAPLDTLTLSTAELVEKYPSNQMIRQLEKGRGIWPRDPEMQMIVQNEIERYRAKEQNPDFKPDLQNVLDRLDPAVRAKLQSKSPADRLGALQELPVATQYDFVAAIPGGDRQKIYAIAPEAYRRQMELFGGPQRVVADDLVSAKIYRAVYSNRQLEQVLTDFWYNHFNVFLDKGADRYATTSYEREAIRPYVLGKFKDLLLATAKSPAMLFYLDNFQSVRPDLDQKVKGNQARRGLNENYGRELMELHTLGVDGGYTQKDVTEVARCFTGWTIRAPRQGGGFYFDAKLHDAGEKHVLGVTIPARGGIDDGYKVIDLLAHHPSTARFISKSLAVRFVSDNPPQSLVDRMTKTYLKSDGDLRKVMKTMIDSPEFFSQSGYRTKIKSPFEMVASALRATNADISFTNSIANQLNQLGEPLYRKLEPTGYSNKSSDWLNSAALLGRMNFALSLTEHKLPGVTPQVPDTTDADQMARVLLGSDLTPDSRHVVDQGLSSDQSTQPVSYQPQGHLAVPANGLLAGLILGSPDFQRR